MEFRIEYREKGEKEIKLIDVDFVSNNVIRRYNKMISDSKKVTLLWETIKEHEAKRMKLKEDKQEGWKQEYKDLKNENESLSDEIKAIGTTDYFEKRHEILNDIMIDNTKDTDLLNYDFWDKHIDAGAMMTLLAQIMVKDMPKGLKKKEA